VDQNDSLSDFFLNSYPHGHNFSKSAIQQKSRIAGSFVAIKLLHNSCRLIGIELCLLQKKAVRTTAIHLQ